MTDIGSVFRGVNILQPPELFNRWHDRGRPFRGQITKYLAKPSCLFLPPPSLLDRQPQQDYRSEGEQPSTARDGARRLPSYFDYDYDIRRSQRRVSKQDSFRAGRMPKRGGRKRLRRPVIRSIRRKIRVSSYCVARELQTLELLRWLESRPNRRLSQSLRAEGGAVPHGPVGAGTPSRSVAGIRTIVPGAGGAEVTMGGWKGSAVSGGVGASATMAGRASFSLDADLQEGAPAPAGPSPQLEVQFCDRLVLGAEESPLLLHWLDTVHTRRRVGVFCFSKLCCFLVKIIYKGNRWEKIGTTALQLLSISITIQYSNLCFAVYRCGFLPMTALATKRDSPKAVPA